MKRLLALLMLILPLAVLAVIVFARTLRARNRAIVDRPLTDAEHAEAARLLAQVSSEQKVAK